MSVESELRERSGNRCELCSSQENLAVYEVYPSDGSADRALLLCDVCMKSVDNPAENLNHWHCLNESMWSQLPVVRVSAYRILKKIAHEGWPQDMLDMLYLEPEVEAWAKEGLEKEEEKAQPVRDSNGNILQEGDAVSIIKDLPVKGAGFTAKQGTTVKNIHLLADDPTHIEGRVNGVKIFLKTEFLKKL